MCINPIKLIGKEVDIIIPVPSSKTRMYQPAIEIAHSIADNYGIGFDEDVLEKVSSLESKNMDKNNKALEGTIIASKKATRSHKVLLVDDLYSTGSTLTECVKALRKDRFLKKIYALVITKTR